MTDTIVNHGHCLMCGRVVTFGDKTCSDKCKGDQEDMQKKRKQYMLMLYGAMGFALLLFVLQAMGIVR
ncbi:MAG: DUF2116 family Zn-ribbon domain-containing protein [Euryarchaeota archaeon]|nr:DUF2116 family Zn-ribbon domain-containing protein [Euryarchaeota archaeon]